MPSSSQLKTVKHAALISFEPSNSQMSGDDDGRMVASQRGDLPDMSQDTMLLFPGLVREQCMKMRIEGDWIQGGDSGGMGGSGRERHKREATMRNSLARASLMSTLSGAKSLQNPFLNASSPDKQKEKLGEDDGEIGFTKLMGDASESFRAEGSLLPPFVLPKMGGGFELEKNVKNKRAMEHAELDKLRLLLVSSTQGRKFALDFEQIREAGKGAFSEVFQARHRVDGCTYAVKRNVNPMMTNGQRMDALQEVFALSALQPHPNILRYNDSWFEEKGRFLHIQTEFLEEGSLFDVYVKQRRRMPPQELLALATDMSSALAYMHRKDIVHLDVKPDNIFRTCRGLSRKSYVIGDFGLACHEDGRDARSTEGDARYLCPEALANEPVRNNLIARGTADGNPFTADGDKAKADSALKKMAAKADFLDLRARDVFALGATIYELATAVPLKMSGGEWLSFRQNTAKAVREIDAICESRELANLVRQCLELDPRERATASRLLSLCETQVHFSADTSSCTEKLKKENAELRKCVRTFETLTGALLKNGEKHRKRYRESCAQKKKMCSTVEFCIQQKGGSPLLIDMSRRH